MTSLIKCLVALPGKTPGPGSFDPRGIQYLGPDSSILQTEAFFLEVRHLQVLRVSQFPLSYSRLLKPLLIDLLCVSGSVSAPSPTLGHAPYSDATKSTTASLIPNCCTVNMYLYLNST